MIAPASQSSGGPARSRSRAGALRSALACAAVLTTLCIAGRAHAHRNSIGYSVLTVADDRTDIAYQLELEPVDVAEMLGLPPDTDPSAQDVATGEKKLLDSVLERIQVLGDDKVCPTERVGAHLIQEGGRLVELAWRVHCPQPISILAVEYDLFFDVDPQHQGFLRALYGGQTAQVILSADESRFVWRLGAPAPTGRLDFLAKGVEHILRGFDHIAFLLGLLFVVTITTRRERTGTNGAVWEQRGLGAGLRYTATIVTSFTLAHSLTLIAASLGWISLPGALVESVIAASIVYVAIEDIFKPDQRYRYVITFAFGLMHGLGFASQLEAYLPPEDVIMPLVLFNVGVELGQLAIVICVLPLLHAITHVAGATRYRMRLMPAGSIILAILGTLWLIERVFSVTILGF